MVLIKACLDGSTFSDYPREMESHCNIHGDVPISTHPQLSVAFSYKQTVLCKFQEKTRLGPEAPQIPFSLAGKMTLCQMYSLRQGASALLAHQITPPVQSTLAMSR